MARFLAWGSVVLDRMAYLGRTGLAELTRFFALAKGLRVIFDGVWAMLKQIIVVALLLGFAVPGVAQVTSIEAARAPVKDKDPNRKICEKIETTGTRVGSRRVCMTAADWATQRQDNRNDLERAQRNVNLRSSG